ncbi:MAG: VOC family protein [Marmoricola sp.]
MTISHGPMTQVAWVTDDLEATEAALGGQFGITKWTRMGDVHFGPETCTYRGKPADFHALVSLAYSGDLQLELIQPVSGDSIYTEHLERKGPGLHHTCFEVDDVDAAVDEAVADGWECVQRGSMSGLMEFAYLEREGVGTSCIELCRIGDDLKAMFAAMKGGVA